MAHYKLMYFNLKARAEVSRILLELGNQKYEDYRAEFSEWPTLKPKLIFGQLPVLEITENGKTVTLAQSHTIERYLASEFGFDGKSKIEKAQCDMLAEQVRDCVDSLINLYRKPSSDEKKSEIEKFFADTEKGFPSKFSPIQNQLAANKDGNGFLVGNSLTYADILLVTCLDWLFSRRASILSQHPLIQQHEQKMLSLPVIGDHLKKYANLQLTILKPE
jgi:glutathione S-transferase